ncbi:hypothetical protein N658DRAFT_504072 [Parathielavia hyrcaniae]|uniref:Uncharacterized protein n=1 Tax=Parathielavia hyrcaniae TaxID=113614 RepID=A0AAN6Q925_9PEZI|nr:hypothetical protein N658DRAFT_504072 [Parathielavia hyrcaniae]
MPPKHPNPFTTPLHPPTPASAQAAYNNIEQQSNPPTSHTVTPDLTPHQIATKRAKSAKSRLATAHEAWTLVAQTLLKHSIIIIIPANQDPQDSNSKVSDLTREMQAFGDAICGRYAAASFLWRVLEDMDGGDWFGRGSGSGDDVRGGKFEATLRRLGTLRGLEGSLGCWEGVLLGLVELVEGLGQWQEGEGRKEVGGKGEWEKRKGEVVEEVRRVLTGWRRGLPGTP